MITTRMTALLSIGVTLIQCLKRWNKMSMLIKDHNCIKVDPQQHMKGHNPRLKVN